MLLEWLSEAEQTLRFRGILPEEVETLQALLHTHRDFMQTVEEKRVDVNKAAGMGEAILAVCHPDCITTIKHWITIIRARFEEVVQLYLLYVRSNFKRGKKTRKAFWSLPQVATACHHCRLAGRLFVFMFATVQLNLMPKKKPTYCCLVILSHSWHEVIFLLSSWKIVKIALNILLLLGENYFLITPLYSMSYIVVYFWWLCFQMNSWICLNLNCSASNTSDALFFSTMRQCLRLYRVIFTFILSLPSKSHLQCPASCYHQVFT